jgi:hypothetical protein
MSELTIFDRALAAHAKWKYRLYQAIKTGQSDWSVAELRTDNRCDFGAWLRGLPMPERTSERCERVRALHTEFHASAAEVLTLALAGQKQDAEKAIAIGSRFTNISTDLTMELSAWKDSEAGS